MQVKMKQVKDVIRLLLENEDPDFWIQKTVNSLTPEKLKQAIENNENPFVSFLDSDYMKFKGIRDGARSILARNWRVIEYYTMKPRNLLNKLMENSANAEVLSSQEAERWIQDVAWDTYWKLRDFTFQERKKILETLMEEPEIPYRDLKDIMEVYEMPIEILNMILRDLENEGVITTWIVLNEKYRG